MKNSEGGRDVSFLFFWFVYFFRLFVFSTDERVHAKGQGDGIRECSTRSWTRVLGQLNTWFDRLGGAHCTAPGGSRFLWLRNRWRQMSDGLLKFTIKKGDG